MARVFVGPLCRYYAGVRRAEAERLAAGVLAWRRDLVAALADRVQQQLNWREDADADIAEFDLGEAGWPAVRLFAFYAERSDLELPDTVPPLLELDRDYRAAHDDKFAKSRYGQLLACTVWLPAAFPLTLRAPMPDGSTAEIGSLVELQDQLRRLNQRTFAADQDVVAGWGESPAPAGGDLLAAAQRGFAALSRAVAAGIAARAPIVVSD